MNANLALLPIFLLARISLQAEVAPVVLERGPHHKVVEMVETVTGDDGQESASTNRYTELVTGMHTRDAVTGEWVEADPAIRIVDGKGRVDGTQHKAEFSGNVNDPAGAVKIQTPDGRTIRIRTLGLLYTNPANGDSVLFAATKDSQGETDLDTTIWFSDILDTVKADLRIKSHLSGIESDVVIREQLPEPQEFGLPNNTSRLEVLHEILEAPDAALSDGRIERGNGQVDVDSTLDFGSMSIPLGNAFTLPANSVGPSPVPLGGVILVAKEHFVLNGRRFFVESVPYLETANLIRGFVPEREEAFNVRPDRKGSERVIAKSRRSLPTSLFASGANSSRELERERMLAASTGPSRARSRGPGLVIDYITVNGTSSNYTFTGGTSYFINGSLTLSGTTTLEGGAVLKFQTNHIGSINITGGFVCKTLPHFPAVLTARQDTLYGENVLTGTLTNTYANYALNFTSTASSATISNIVVRYANYGISFNAGTSNVIQNAQFYGCLKPINAVNATVDVRNALIHKSGDYVFTANNSTLRGENLTIHEAPCLFLNSGSSLVLTNSIIAVVTSTNGYSGAFNHFSSSSDIFTSGGTKGGHYLADSSLRNIGSTDIVGLAELRKLTTFPPVLLDSAITTDTILFPQAPADADAPDYGYHYGIADYCLGNITLTAQLTLTNGVSIATHSDKAIIMSTGSKIISVGRPEKPNRIFRYTAVQEQPGTFGNGNKGALFHLEAYTTRELRFRFTDFYFLADSESNRSILGNFNFAYGAVAPLAISDSFLRGAAILATTYYGGSSFNLTNNIFLYSAITFQQGSDGYATYYYYDLNLYNNLFDKGTTNKFIYNSSYTTWNIKDNFFNSDVLTKTGSASLTAATHNGYKSGHSAIYTHASNVTGLVADYVTGHFGDYYYPTSGGATSLNSLRNVGSRTAANAGLYHFTVNADGSEEGSSQVEIGAHFVASEGIGIPSDDDADSIINVFEDLNGDGSASGDLSSWTSYNSPNSFGSGAFLQVFTPLR